MARATKYNADERLYRKRLAARLRQRRCRERKKLGQMVQMKVVSKKDFDSQAKGVTTSNDKAGSSVGAPPKKNSPTPPTYQTREVRVVHYPVPSHSVFRACGPAYPRYPPHGYSAMPARPMHMPLQAHYHPHMHPHGIPPHPAMMPHMHPSYLPPHPSVAHQSVAHQSASMIPTAYAAPVPATNPVPTVDKAASTAPKVPRTVSRSASDTASVDSDGSSSTNLPQMTKCTKAHTHAPKPLATEEKTAVAAILSLKDSSSDEDDNSTIVSETTLPSTNLNQAFAQASAQQVSAVPVTVTAATVTAV